MNQYERRQLKKQTTPKKKAKPPPKSYSEAQINRIKSGRFYNELIAEGFKPHTPEWRREVKKRSKLWENMSEESKKKHLEAAKKRYHKNIEDSREYERKKKSAYREKNKEAINENQRDLYHKEREANAEKQRLRRYRREPHRAIRAYTDLYLQGLLDDEQYTKSVDEYIARTEQIEREELRGGEELGEENGAFGEGGV